MPEPMAPTKNDPMRGYRAPDTTASPRGEAGAVLHVPRLQDPPGARRHRKPPARPILGSSSRQALKTAPGWPRRDNLLPEFRPVRVPRSRYEKHSPASVKIFHQTGGNPTTPPNEIQAWLQWLRAADVEPAWLRSRLGSVPSGEVCCGGWKHSF